VHEYYVIVAQSPGLLICAFYNRSEHSFWAIYALARDTWTVFASIYASLTFNALLLLAVRCLVVIPFFSKGSQLVCGYCGSVGLERSATLRAG
jgi:hypothetical protein